MRARLILVVVALIAIASCGKSSTPTNPSPTSSPLPSGSTVSIVQGASALTTTAFNPNPLNITRGMTVTWVNNDNTTHTSSSNAGTWNSGNIAPGGNFSVTFQSAGTFPYQCTIHPNMVGTVTVQ